MKKQRIIALVLLTAALTTTASCSWFGWLLGHKQGKADPITVTHLEWLQSSASPLDSCGTFVAYEQAKIDSKSPMADSKSLKDVQRICDCFGKADAAVAVELTACRDKIPVALAYEHQKPSH